MAGGERRGRDGKGACGREREGSEVRRCRSSVRVNSVADLGLRVAGFHCKLGAEDVAELGTIAITATNDLKRNSERSSEL